jgi:hypothetical protein
MIKGGWKSIAFLSGTGVVIVWELFSSFDDDPSTSPLTDLIVTYVPQEVTAALIGMLLLWLPTHFGLRYYRKARASRRSSDDD